MSYCDENEFAFGDGAELAGFGGDALVDELFVSEVLEDFGLVLEGLVEGEGCEESGACGDIESSLFFGLVAEHGLYFICRLLIWIYYSEIIFFFKSEEK
jgi:hypothetical protein